MTEQARKKPHLRVEEGPVSVPTTLEIDEAQLLDAVSRLRGDQYVLIEEGEAQTNQDRLEYWRTKFNKQYRDKPVTFSVIVRDHTAKLIARAA